MFDLEMGLLWGGPLMVSAIRVTSFSLLESWSNSF